ncbi:MAG: hypothetical protein VKM17_10370 [Cyanobacteriota bacterium]|nr:hypothetical protein [Cyanobacteriota bacterium]
MQPSPGEAAPAALSAPMGVVVVGSGSEASFRSADGPTELAARRLARVLALPYRPIADPADPHRQLRHLQSTPGGWLSSLPLDPGQALADGSTWAEALGAWCQPALVILGAHQLSSGAAASTTALLRQWHVPLLGLLQWGGSWKAKSRRRDGLPWLGRLEEAPVAEGSDSAHELAELLLRRWALLDLPWSPSTGEQNPSQEQKEDGI